ncbi:Acb2/Tad1 domain-containing protein [Paenibacillus sp. FSL R5-0527]|uniref:Acb2/Tad1 domain-containing protein n=1 Tax=Paenibacillus sp. FSL R5-0527 TaxID=2975321 RepID=UPI004047C5F8
MQVQTPCSQRQGRCPEPSSTRNRTTQARTRRALDSGREVNRMDQLQKALIALSEALQEVQKLDNSRERSVAITHIETAELWLGKLEEQ